MTSFASGAPLDSYSQKQHPAGVRAMHFAWAMREQREHRTAPFFIEPRTLDGQALDNARACQGGQGQPAGI